MSSHHATHTDPTHSSAQPNTRKPIWCDPDNRLGEIDELIAYTSIRKALKVSESTISRDLSSAYAKIRAGLLDALIDEDDYIRADRVLGENRDMEVFLLSMIDIMKEHFEELDKQRAEEKARLARNLLDA